MALSLVEAPIGIKEAVTRLFQKRRKKTTSASEDASHPPTKKSRFHPDRFTSEKILYKSGSFRQPEILATKLLVIHGALPPHPFPKKPTDRRHGATIRYIGNDVPRSFLDNFRTPNGKQPVLKDIDIRTHNKDGNIGILVEIGTMPEKSSPGGIAFRIATNGRDHVGVYSWSGHELVVDNGRLVKLNNDIVITPSRIKETADFAVEAMNFVGFLLKGNGTDQIKKPIGIFDADLKRTVFVPSVLRNPSTGLGRVRG